MAAPTESSNTRSVSPGYYRVRKGRTLFVPGVQDPNMKVWARQGQVVDLREQVAADATAGQAYKLDRIDGRKMRTPRRGANKNVESPVKMPIKVQQAIKDAKRVEGGGKPESETERQARSGGVDPKDLPPASSGVSGEADTEETSQEEESE